MLPWFRDQWSGEWIAGTSVMALLLKIFDGIWLPMRVSFSTPLTTLLLMRSQLPSLAHQHVANIRQQEWKNKGKTMQNFRKLIFLSSFHWNFLANVALGPNVIIYIKRFLVIQRTSRSRCARKLNYRFKLDWIVSLL